MPQTHRSRGISEIGEVPRMRRRGWYPVSPIALFPNLFECKSQREKGEAHVHVDAGAVPLDLSVQNPCVRSRRARAVADPHRRRLELAAPATLDIHAVDSFWRAYHCRASLFAHEIQRGPLPDDMWCLLR